MQNWGFSKTGLRLTAIVGVLAGMLTIFGCGGGEEQAQVAATNTVVPATAATVQAVEGVQFSLPAGAFAASANAPGAPGLANQTTTVAFNNTATATPTATITAPNVRGTDGNPARLTSTATFGSCTFRVTTSTFPVPPGPAVGDTITVNPCQVNVQTGGVQATGNATTVQILLQLGLIPSAAQQAQVSISPTGVVTVNNVTVPGTVTLQVVTGGGGG